MEPVHKSAGDCVAISSATPTGNGALPALARLRTQRDGQLTIHELADQYISWYAGRDTSRPQRIAFWCTKLGDVRLADLTDDDVYFILQDLATERGRYWCGNDADGRPIFKAKRKPFAPASINRYAAALGAMLTWAVKHRIAPRGWENPCRRLERRTENNSRVRYLSDDERERLLAACRRSKWPKLYLLVLLALTTGARRGELERLRWADVDLDQAVATLHESKNGDRRVLPLVPVAVEELRKHVSAAFALVFPSKRQPDTAYNHVPVWHAALRSAVVRDFRFHDLRHSCASYLAQSGASLVQIADVLGHRNLAVTRRYRRTPLLRASAWKQQLECNPAREA
ncbi:MAG: tyrosine-type recombinase/integrase [Casimicrobiaceae bacterium]